MARLLILGAGLHQLAGIRAAKDFGCEVITTDDRPDNPGHRLGDRFVCCSTVDVESVVAVAQELDVDGVVTFASDVSTPAVAAATQALGLPGPSPIAVTEMSDKLAFRRAMRRGGIDGPDVMEIPPAGADYGEVAGHLGAPFVVKPPDASGSKGVVIVRQPSDFDRAVDAARGSSRTGRAFAESHLPGVEVGGDAFFAAGQLEFIGITQKFMTGVTVTGHAAPSTCSDREYAAIADAVRSAAGFIGYRDGPLNFDVMLDGDRATVIEMSPRTGGNGIPDVLGMVHGVPLLRWTVEFALGRPLESRHRPTAAGAGSLVLGSDRAGRLVSHRDESALRTAVPQLRTLDLAVRAGDDVEALAHGGHALGVAVFELLSEDGYAEIAERVQAALAFEVHR